MRLLLVSPIPPPVGGIASWSVNFLNYYSLKKSSWDIIHQNTAIKFRNITNESIFHRLYGGIRDTINILTEFNQNLRKYQPQVVHLTSSASIALFKDLVLIRIAKKRKIPIIIHFRFGRIPQLAAKKNWEWQILCLVVKQSTITIVIDEKSFNVLKEFRFKNIVNISNPISVELEEIAKLNQSTPTARTKGKVVFIGHVVKSKGIFELVKACIPIPGIKELLLIGPFEDRIKEDLLILARKRDNGSWLIFTGNLDKGEVINQLRSASIMSLPSYTEGFPNVVIEAMAVGCPVIATEVGAIPDMLDCSSDIPCGICVKPKDVNELKNAITTLINDTEKAKFMGQNGTARVLKNYNFSSVSMHYEKVWNDAQSH